MTMPTALEIARQATLKPITEIAEDIGIPPWLVEQHGEHVAKIDLRAIEALQDRPNAKYIVVTAITPTPLGEGKTTTTIGLGRACRHIGKKAMSHSPAAKAPRSASRAARPAAAIVRSFRSRSSTCI